jgi:hypothetical protein
MKNIIFNKIEISEGGTLVTMPVKYFTPKVNVNFINMLFISTGIFDDKLRPQILSVGTTANSPLNNIRLRQL